MKFFVLTSKHLRFATFFMLASFIWVQSVESRQDNILPTHRELTDPITLRYHPIPPSKWTISANIKGKINDKSYSGVASFFGDIKIKEKDDHLVWSFSVNDFNTEFFDFDATEIEEIKEFLPFLFRFSADSRGNVIGIKIDQGNKFWKLVNHQQRKQIIHEFDKQIKNSESSVLPVYPIRAVKQADELFSRVLIPNEESGLNIKLKEVGFVKGEFFKDGRKSILVETNIGIIENQFPIKINWNGFNVIDAQTGIPTHTRTKMEANGNLKGEKFILDIDLNYKIFLSSTLKNEKHLASDKPFNSSIEERLITLKKLLDTDLITKDEAAAKRKAILDSM
jgi:hypothetical protein